MQPCLTSLQKQTRMPQALLPCFGSTSDISRAGRLRIETRCSWRPHAGRILRTFRPCTHTRFGRWSFPQPASNRQARGYPERRFSASARTQNTPHMQATDVCSKTAARSKLGAPSSGSLSANGPHGSSGDVAIASEVCRRRRYREHPCGMRLSPRPPLICQAEPQSNTLSEGASGTVTQSPLITFRRYAVRHLVAFIHLGTRCSKLADPVLIHAEPTPHILSEGASSTRTLAFVAERLRRETRNLLGSFQAQLGEKAEAGADAR